MCHARRSDRFNSRAHHLMLAKSFDDPAPQACNVIQHVFLLYLSVSCQPPLSRAHSSLECLSDATVECVRIQSLRVLSPKTSPHVSTER